MIHVIKNFLLKQINPWCVDNLLISEGNVKIKGWILDSNFHYGLSDVYCNGLKAKTTIRTESRNDLEIVFPYYKNASISGFECSFEFNDKGIAIEDFRFSIVQDGNNLNPWFDYYYPLNSTCPLPSEHDRVRVHGNSSISGFILEGFSIYCKLIELWNGQSKLPIFRNPRVLDWGCGCARVSRYFDTSKVNLWGADVDEVNLQWCKDYTGINTVRLTPNPPTSLPKNYFDLIFGISVMSHLDPSMQTDWLKELAESLRSNGLIMLSVHGISAALRALSDDLYQQFMCNGHLELGSNNHLKDVVPNAKYYRDTFVDSIHILRKWTKYFSVVQYMESIIGNHQDLVIMKRK